jgi:hypothetical protein
MKAVASIAVLRSRHLSSPLVFMKLTWLVPNPPFDT